MVIVWTLTQLRIHTSCDHYLKILSNLQSMLDLKDLALDLSCLSSIPASCLRSLSATYLIYTHTLTTHNCTSISFNANFNDEQLAAVQAMKSCVADIREEIVVFLKHHPLYLYTQIHWYKLLTLIQCLNFI